MNPIHPPIVFHLADGIAEIEFRAHVWPVVTIRSTKRELPLHITGGYFSAPVRLKALLDQAQSCIESAGHVVTDRGEVQGGFQFFEEAP